MVEYEYPLDSIFYSLSDPIRRDILSKVALREYSVGELVSYYAVSFAAISKHLKVLEEACLIRKRKNGRMRMVSLVPSAMKEADNHLHYYRQLWQDTYNAQFYTNSEDTV